MRKATILIIFIAGLWIANLSFAAALAQQEDSVQGNDTATLFRSIGMMYLGAQDIPDFEVTRLNGETMNLSDLQGKIVFLNFWATWCPPCQAEMPSIERLSEQFKGTDIEILAVSVGENAETVQEFLSKTPYSFPIALNPDGKLGALYARSIPTTYILNRDGNIIAAKIGAQEWDTEKIASVFRHLLEQDG
jgi:thiol-disulfide isomerase/thioredoxin